MYRSPTAPARSAAAVVALALIAAGCGDGPAAPADPIVARAATMHGAEAAANSTDDKDKDKDKDKDDGLPAGVRLYAAMDGQQPVPNDLADHAGSGRAEFSLSAAEGRACVAVTLATAQYREITGSHIHPSPAGAASAETVIDWTDAVVAQLREDGTAVGCTYPGAAAVERILADPAGFYFNIHTPANGIPDGGILRGQLTDRQP